MSAVQLGLGLPWQSLTIGQVFSTRRRTVGEAELAQFVGVTGMFEAMFLDAGHGGAIGGRPVPAALTYAVIEGFLVQTLLQGVGLALLEMSMKVLAPVRIGDTIWATSEITAVRPTSKNDRAVVDANVTVFNQDGAAVLSYTARRLIAGAEKAAGG